MITSDPTKAKTMCPHCLALQIEVVCESESDVFDDGTTDLIVQCEDCNEHYIEVVDSSGNFVDRLKIQLGEDELGTPMWVYTETGQPIR